MTQTEALRLALDALLHHTEQTRPILRTDAAIEACRAALSAPAAQPVPAPARDDGMPASADERRLRRLLAARVGMPHTYYDDGEAQGQEHGITIDFMREPVADIEAKLRALNVARAAQPLAPAPVTKPPCDEAIRHAANEWADMAINGLQWLRNIVEGISDPTVALDSMESNMSHCRQVNDAAFGAHVAPAAQPVPVVQPLTDEQKIAEFSRPCYQSEDLYEWFDAGVRFAERAHGIGGANG